MNILEYVTRQLYYGLGPAFFSWVIIAFVLPFLDAPWFTLLLVYIPFIALHFWSINRFGSMAPLSDFTSGQILSFAVLGLSLMLAFGLWWGFGGAEPPMDPNSPFYNISS